MSLSLSENFFIVTKLTPAQVQAKLDDLVTLHNYKLNGYAADGVFKLKPVVNYAKSFGVDIEGLVETYDGGSRIQVRIRRPTVLLVLCSITMVIAIAIIVRNVFVKGHGFSISPWLLIFLTFIILNGNSKYEGRNVKIDLMNVFKGEEQAV